MQSIRLGLLCVAMCLWTVGASGQSVGGTTKQIAIKGISLGMTAQEIDQVAPSIGSITVGGVSQSAMPYVLNDGTGKLDAFVWYFAADSFDKVMAAVRWKYPAIKCKDSETRTRAGVSHQQTVCMLDDERGRLTVIRFGENITQGQLSLQSKALIRRAVEAEIAAMRDI